MNTQASFQRFVLFPYDLLKRAIAPFTTRKEWEDLILNYPTHSVLSHLAIEAEALQQESALIITCPFSRYQEKGDTDPVMTCFCQL